MEIFYPGPGHTIDNVVVWLPALNILFGGCFVKSLHSKSLGYVKEASINQWSQSIDTLIARYPSTKLVIPGHGMEGGQELLVHTHRLASNAVALENSK